MVGRVLVWGFFLLTLGLMLVDTFFSFEATLRHFGLNSTFVFILFLLTIIGLAFLKRYFFPEQFLKINRRIITPLLAILAVGLVLINYSTYSNFDLAHFHLNIENFILLAILFGSVTYVEHSKNMNIAQKLVYFVGPLFLLLMIFIDYLSEDLFKFLNIEDGIIENTQFAFYLGSSLINLWLAYLFLRKKDWVNSIIFLGLGMMLFFVAGEEISWGQRILGLKTPEIQGRVNLQNELNVHNDSFFQSNIHYFYMSLGLFCSLSGVFLLKFYRKIKSRYHLIIPSTLTFFYFFAIFVYYFLNQYLIFYYQIFSARRTGLGRWQEVAEVLLTTGFLIFAISAYKKNRHEKTFLNKPNVSEGNPLI